MRMAARPLLLLCGALVALGCSPRPSETEPAPPPAEREPPAEPGMVPVEPRAPDPAHEAQAAALVDWLAGCAVTDRDFARRKVYTWTRTDQIEALRARPTLLTRERSSGGQPSLFDMEIARDDHPLARHLVRPGRRTRRFAWVTPWATRMGWEGSDYGDRLIQLTLREDAWVARFDPDAEGEERWTVVDEAGAEVPRDRVARNLGRIAAVHHLGRGDRVFREVVVVNEDQIARWSVATDAIRERLAHDAERLRALAAYWEATPPEGPADPDAWFRGAGATPRAQSTRAEPSAALLEAYRACLALGSDHYTPSAEHALAIAEALEATPFGDPLEHRVRRRRRRPLPAALPVGTHSFPCDPTMGGCPP